MLRNRTRAIGMLGMSVAVWSVAGSAAADVFVDVDARGVLERRMAPGDTVQVSVRTDATGGDAFDSAVFRVVFTEPGLELRGYGWDAPFETDTLLDGSLAGVDAFPVLLDAETLEGPLLPDDTVDVDFDNFLLVGDYDSGELVRFTLRVPGDFAYRGSIFVAAVPDTFALGFLPIEAATGTLLELVIEDDSPADLTGDGVIDGADLAALLSAWGTDGTLPDDTTADLDGDGVVSGADLTLLLSTWT